MTIDMTLITGFMLGFEYVDMREQTDEQHIVVDLFVFRIVFTWFSD